MTVDIRAKIYCDLGEVISGGFSDDHVQGTGLIRTRGDLVINGLVKPSYGQLVQLGWRVGTTFSRIPRALRVLSYFADPFRRTTTIQLGCKFTLFANAKPGDEKDRYFYSKEDPNNKDLPCALYDVALLPVSASSIAAKCLTALGLTGTTGLTNWYAADKIDLNPGYVSVLNDLLYAESKVGYLRADETFHVVSLNDNPSTSKVIRSTDVIDISAISGGEPPVDAVGIRYSYTRYKKPETTSSSEARWELTETYDPIQQVRIPYDKDSKEFIATFTPYAKIETEYDRFDRVIKTTKTTTRHIAQVNPTYIALLLDAGLIYPSIKPLFYTVYNVTETYNDYERSADVLTEAPGDTAFECLSEYLQNKLFNPDRDAQPVGVREYTYVSDMEIAGALGIQAYHFVDRDGRVSVLHPGTTSNRLVQKVETTYDKIEIEELGDIYSEGQKSKNITVISKEVTVTKRAQYQDQQYQQLYADRALYITTTGALGTIIGNASALTSTDTQTQIVTGKTFNVQRRPKAEEVSDASNRKGIRTAEDTTEIEFITGSETSSNSRIYDLPLAPDDRIVYLGGGVPGSWSVTQSDVKTKAINFARAQNRLNLGHRYGFSLQLTAENMPPYPMDGLAVEGSGALALFLANGTSWAFDSNGIVCNTDAVYWAGLGSTDPGYQIWFQVQPGISLLPSVTTSTNPSPSPVNSETVSSGFDPNDAISSAIDYELITDSVTTSSDWGLITAVVAPPTVDWNDDLDGWSTIPYDTAPVYGEYLTDPSLIPAYLEKVSQTLPVVLQADVTSVYPQDIDITLDTMAVRLQLTIPEVKPEITVPVILETTVDTTFFDYTLTVHIEADVTATFEEAEGMLFGYVLV